MCQALRRYIYPQAQLDVTSVGPGDARVVARLLRQCSRSCAQSFTFAAGQCPCLSCRPCDMHDLIQDNMLPLSQGSGAERAGMQVYQLQSRSFPLHLKGMHQPLAHWSMASNIAHAPDKKAVCHAQILSRRPQAHQHARPTFCCPLSALAGRKHGMGLSRPLHSAA